MTIITTSKATSYDDILAEVTKKEGGDILFISKALKEQPSIRIKIVAPPQDEESDEIDTSWFRIVEQEFNGKINKQVAFVGIIIEGKGKYTPKVVVLNKSGSASLFRLLKADWNVLDPVQGLPIEFSQNKSNPSFPLVVGQPIGKSFDNSLIGDVELPDLDETLKQLNKPKEEKNEAVSVEWE
jgi:hypothetical protein